MGKSTDPLNPPGFWSESSDPPPKAGRQHRTFKLYQEIDHSGLSGTGVVAEGVQFSSGTVVVEWAGAYPSVVTWRDLSHLEAVNGHGGSTRVIWDG